MTCIIRTINIHLNYYILKKGCRIVFGFFCLRFWIFFGFLSRYHLPCIWNSLELEPVILHGICYILAWSLCILHGICYIWPCLPSILHGNLLYFGISTSDLHGICYILVLQTFMWVSWGFFRLSFRVSFRVSFNVLFRASFGVSFRVSLRFHLGLHLGLHLGCLYGFM